jgi:hypothetical protein
MARGATCADLTRRFKHALRLKGDAELEMTQASKRIRAIADRAGRGRPSVRSGSRWSEQSYKDRPTSPALMRAYNAAVKRAQAAQGKAWNYTDEVRNLRAAIRVKGCPSGLLFGAKSRRKRRR